MKRNGFTLIELLMYMAISTVAVLVFVNFMVDVTRVSARMKVAKEVDQNARYVMDRLTQDIRGANDVCVVSGELHLNGGTTTYSFSSTAVMLNGANLTGSTVKVAGQFDQTNCDDPVTVTLNVQNADGAPPSAQKQLILTDTLQSHKTLY